MFSPGESLVDVDPFDALLEDVLAEEEMPPKKAAQTTPKKAPSKADEAAGMDAFAKELEGDSDEDLQHVQRPSAAAAPVMREQPERSEPAVYGETASQPQEQRGWLQKLWKGGEGAAGRNGRGISVKLC